MSSYIQSLCVDMRHTMRPPPYRPTLVVNDARARNNPVADEIHVIRRSEARQHIMRKPIPSRAVAQRQDDMRRNDSKKMEEIRRTIPKLTLSNVSRLQYLNKKM